MTSQKSPYPEPDTWIVSRIISWYRKAGREFPWRDHSNPFQILTAEIMLHRTRADQVEPVYRELVGQADSPDQVLELGEDYLKVLFNRLGLKWRSDSYVAMCHELQTEYNGEVPDTRDQLMTLSGVGQYAAGAVLTHAFDIPTVMVDANILRVIGRYHGYQFSDNERRRRDVQAWMSRFIPKDPTRAKHYALGLVDLGATICKPRLPVCGECPIQKRCVYRKGEGDSG